MDSQDQKEPIVIEGAISKLKIEDPQELEGEDGIKSNRPPGYYIHIDLEKCTKKDGSFIGSAINAYMRGKHATDPRLEEGEGTTGVYEFWKVGTDFSVSDLKDMIRRINRSVTVKIMLIKDNNDFKYTLKVDPPLVN